MLKRRCIGIRKIDISVLPKWKDTENINKIKWNDSIGIKVPFEYDGILGDVTILSYKTKTEKLSVKYKDNEPVDIISTNFKDGRLGNVLGIQHYTHKRGHRYNIGDILDVKSGQTKILKRTRVARKNDKNKIDKGYMCECLKCGNINEVLEQSLTRKVGCSVCNGSAVKAGFNDIATLRPDLVEYFCDKNDAEKYGINSHIKVWFKCPECGTKRKIQTKLFIKRKFNCLLCDKTYSKPNKLAYRILSDLEVNFETEKLFQWCRYKKYKTEKTTKGIYDFYFEINDNKYILEMDGGHHKIGRGDLTAKEQNYIDNQKDKLARENDIEVIRIDCFYSNLKYIKEKILNSELVNILDFDLIDWESYKNIFNN